MDQISCPAEKALYETGSHQGLDVSVSQGMYKTESGTLAVMKHMTAAETVDTAATGSRAESGCRAETEVAVAAAAAAAAGRADSVPKILAALLLSAVLAEAQAAEAGQSAWLGGTESESAVGS